jgi:acetyl-CoA synthetase
MVFRRNVIPIEEPIMTRAIADQVPQDSAGAREIGFSIPQTYNASRILFDSLARGHGERLALIGPGGTRSYAQLCADAAQWGHGFLSLGLQRGDRVLLFLDDTPAYPAAFFGAVRAGFVPVLTNTLTMPDLLQFYLSDAGATVAVADAEFCSRFNAEACKDTPLPKPIPIATRWRFGCIPRAPPVVPKASFICSTTWPIAKRRLRATC